MARVNVADEYGQLQSVDEKDLDQAIGMGYRLQTNEEKRDRWLQQEYGGAGGQALAGAAAVARGGTFGGSDWVARGLGVEKETLANLKEANPGISTTGEILGAVAPLVASGGAGLLAKGAQKAGVGVLGLAKGAHKIEKGIEAALTTKSAAQAALATGEAAKAGLLARMAAKGVAGVAEGTVFGAGQLVSEAALGDPEEVAEKALAHLGASALLGFGVGAAMPVLGSVLNRAGTAVGKAGTAALDRALPEGDTVVQRMRRRFAVDSLGGTQDTIKKLGKRYNEVADDLVAPQEALGGKPIFSGSKGEALANIEKVKTFAGDKIDNALGALDEAGATVQAGNIISKIKTQVRDKYSKLVGYKKQVAEIDGYLEDLTSKPGAKFSEINDIRRGVDDLVTYDSFGKPKKTPSNKIRRQIADIIRGEVYDQAEAVAKEKAIPELSENLIEANRLYGSMMKAEPIARKGVASAKGNQLLGLKDVIAGAGTLAIGGPLAGAAVSVGSKILRSRGPALATRALAYVEHDILPRLAKGVATSNAEVDTLINRLLVGAAKTTKRVARVGAEAAEPSLGHTTSHILGDHPPESTLGGKKTRAIARGALILSQKEIGKRIEQINEAKRDPVKYASRVMASVGDDLHKAAPQVAVASVGVATRSMNFMASKLPKTIMTPDAALSIEDPPEMDDRERVKFSRYVRAIEQPDTVIADLVNGDLTMEAAEAFRAVYPARHKALVQKILAHPKEVKAMPYTKKVDLSILMGVPLDKSVVPMFVQMSQAAYTPEGGPQETSAATAPGSPLGIASRAQTASERRQMR